MRKNSNLEFVVDVALDIKNRPMMDYHDVHHSDNGYVDSHSDNYYDNFCDSCDSYYDSSSGKGSGSKGGWQPPGGWGSPWDFFKWFFIGVGIVILLAMLFS